MRTLRIVALAAGVLVLATGCTLTGSASRYAKAPGTVSEPFWCTPLGNALSASDCVTLSMQLDRASFFAHAYFHASDAAAAGATGGSYVPGVGAAYEFHAATSTFDGGTPNTLLYDGTAPNAQVAGLEWNVISSGAPAGFAGTNDVWTDEGGDHWALRAWVLRPFQNQVNVFAPTHPCLGPSSPIYDLDASCYTTTHPNPTEILVTNDDGYNAEGIDAVVEALRDDTSVHLTVSAPATNQSGSGDRTSPGPLEAEELTTINGYPAWAVDGFPADSVLYALNTLHANPDLVVSGINNGQNLGPLVDASGTVGAARIAARANIPAIAVSQGFGRNNPPPPIAPDYPSGVTALLSKIDDFLFGRAGPARFQDVVNINVPTCFTGSIRGTVDIKSGTALNGRPINPSNCNSTVDKEDFTDDVDAFLNGYIAVSTVGKN
jgi:5'-nucleotidase